MRIATIRFVLTVAATVFVALSLQAGQADLPAELQKELKQLEERLTEIEGRIGRFSKDKIDLSLREAKMWVDEFALDAELFDDDPLIVRLHKKLRDLSDKSDEAAKKRAAAMKNKDRGDAKTKERVNIDQMLRIKVDLNNVSFKRDVAPIIANVCMRCHNDNRKSGDFNASTYTSFMTMVEPGDPDGSHVLQLVTGKAEPRMPQGGQTTFLREWANAWSAWIKQGAKFDGTQRNAPITSYMIDLDTQRRQLLARLSTPDLEKLHRSESERHIGIVDPKQEAHFVETANFLVRTTLPQSDAEYIGVLAEAVLEDLTQRFGMVKSQPVWRGRFGLNVFADRVDYLAFANEVDDYSPEPSETGHVRLRPEYPYLAMAVPQAGLDGAVAQHVTAAFLQSLGSRRIAPWAIYGYSRRVGASFQGRSKDPSYNAELEQAARLAASGKTIVHLFGERLPWVELAPLSASFFEFAISTDKKKTAAFLLQFSKSGNAQAAAGAAFNATPDQLTYGWRKWIAKQ